MANKTRLEMNSEVASIIDDSGRSSQINTALQRAYDRIAGWYEWEFLQNYEDRTTKLYAKAITGQITQADPPVVTLTAHGLADGDLIVIFEASGMDKINNRLMTVANQTTNTFELSGEDSQNYDAHTSGSGVVSKAIYAKPTALKAIETARVIRVGGLLDYPNSMLDFIDAANFNDRYPQPSQQGPPLRWTNKAATIQVDPLPTTEEHEYPLYMSGKKQVTAFSGDSSTSDLQEELDDVIIDLASSLMYKILEEDQLSNAYKEFAKETAAEEYTREVAFSTT